MHGKLRYFAIENPQKIMLGQAVHDSIHHWLLRAALVETQKIHSISLLLWLPLQQCLPAVCVYASSNPIAE